MYRKEILRDDREYDKTQLRESLHGVSLHRDYSAHFFRWSFAKNFISDTDNVLEIGCGQDQPLRKILFGGYKPSIKSYVGVDLNRLDKTTNDKRVKIIDQFNFVERHKELEEFGPYDKIVHFEVIEHMKADHGKKFIENCYELLSKDGIMLTSTPAFDGKRHAKNHIHEYTIEEYNNLLTASGFTVLNRFGTFMDVNKIGKAGIHDEKTTEAIKLVHDKLSEYFHNDALSNFFAPLYPDHSRNNLWICKK